MRTREFPYQGTPDPSISFNIILSTEPGELLAEPLTYPAKPPTVMSEERGYAA